MTNTQTPTHVYTFEVWPYTAPGTGSYPLRLAEHVTIEAPDIEIASVAMSRSRGFIPGEHYHVAGHQRGRCNPPHPGQS